MNEPYLLTIAEASSLIRKGALSPVELVTSVLERIKETEDVVHAYVFVNSDAGLAEASAAEAEVRGGQWRGSLHGIPVNLKDVFYTKGIPTEAGSKVLSGFVPNHDSAVGERLREAGAIMIGKTVTPEFAMGRNVVPTRNPWNLDCYSGGSSSGAGVSVAVDSTLGAVGSDAGGSIRGPAAVNGIVALKPTFGRVSRRGMIPSSFTMDTAGPLTKTVLDSALMLNALAGYDSADPTSIDEAVPDFAATIGQGVKGIRLGLDRTYFLHDGVEASVRAAFDAALEVFKSLGATIVEVTIPHLEYAVTAGRTILLVDHSVIHRTWLREKADLYEPGVRLLLEAGELLPATDYLLALKARYMLKHSMRDVFDANALNALVCPTTPTTTAPLVQTSPWDFHVRGENSFEKARHHIPFNLTGQPAISIPCGFSDEKLTIGLEIAGRPFDEEMLIRIACAYEAATSWHLESPPIGHRSLAT